MLEVVGAPKVASELVSDIRLMTGTLWHNWSHDALVAAGVPFMQEVRLAGYLPEGWGGTADWLFWMPEHRGFLLRDKKTMKGEGIRWIASKGAKEEHIWQLSAYWHALYDMGLPMVDGADVLYWPMNDTSDKRDIIQPQLVEVAILPREQVHAVMHQRWAAVQEYIASLEAIGGPHGGRMWEQLMYENPTILLTPALAPEQERVQGIVWNPKTAGGCFDVKLIPHWSTAYCPFPDELCACSAQGTTKIGHYTLDGEYVPREEWESELPMVAPTEADYKKRREAAAKETKEVVASGGA
jgi:hypothetical protein